MLAQAELAGVSVDEATALQRDLSPLAGPRELALLGRLSAPSEKTACSRWLASSVAMSALAACVMRFALCHSCADHHEAA